MKKALFLAIFLAPLFTHGATLQACQPGDIFDVNTGHTCPIATTDNTNSKDILIASLQAEISVLQSEINVMKMNMPAAGVATSTIVMFSSSDSKDMTLNKIDSEVVSLTSDEGSTYHSIGLTQTGTKTYSDLNDKLNDIKEKIRRLQTDRQEVFYTQTPTFPLDLISTWLYSSNL